MRWLLVFLGFFLTLAAQAQVQGFASHDLTSVVDQARIAIDTKASVQATPLNLTMTCASCKGSPVVDIRLGRLTDGTEKRVRSGETTFAKLESLCIKQNPDCRLSTLPVSPAIGWLTVYAFGNGAGSTAVILRDGDLLTIQAKADSRWHAEESVRALVQRLAPRIVGP